MDLSNWNLSEEFVHDYLKAVDDSLPTYSIHGLVPPVALAARALGSLLEHLDLPPGAIHSLQELTTYQAVLLGEPLRGTATVGQPKKRGALQFIDAAVTLSNRRGEDVLSSKSTVLVVKPGYQAAAGKEAEAARPRRETPAEQLPGELQGNGATTNLPKVTKTVTLERLKAYSEVSSDHNPIHLDAEFAATTQLGGTIAHGMLTLAYISEMMAMEYDKAWLSSGALKVRFKGAAYLGDTVETCGRVEKQETVGWGQRLNCRVGVSNKTTGQELVTGRATVIV